MTGPPRRLASAIQPPRVRFRQGLPRGLLLAMLLATLATGASRDGRGALLGSAAAAGEVDRILLLDGDERTGAIRALSRESGIHLKGAKEPIPWEVLWRLRRPVAENPRGPEPLAIYLHDGAALALERLTVEEGTAKGRWAYRRDLALPLAQVRAIRLLPPPQRRAKAEARQAHAQATEAFATLLAAPAEAPGADGPRDRLLVHTDTGTRVVPGLFESLDEKKVGFRWRDASRTIDRDKVIGIRLARAAGAGVDDETARLWLQDGSTLRAQVHRLDGGKLIVEALGREVKLPWREVVRLERATPGMIALADLEPTAVAHEAILTVASPWRRDRAFGGGPLRIGARSFERGLGVHARNALTYPVPEGVNAFAAWIGLDEGANAAPGPDGRVHPSADASHDTANRAKPPAADASQAPMHGHGDCEFVVLVDGEERLRERMRASDEAKAIQIDLAGARELTLVVEPGEDLDLGDHANWAEARLLRDANR